MAITDKTLVETIKTACNYTCQKCGWKPSTPEEQSGLHIHHLRPTKQGGTDEPNNLLLVCWKCHAKIHADIDNCERIASSRRYAICPMKEKCTSKCIDRCRTHYIEPDGAGHGVIYFDKKLINRVVILTITPFVERYPDADPDTRPPRCIPEGSPGTIFDGKVNRCYSCPNCKLPAGPDGVPAYLNPQHPPHHIKPDSSVVVPPTRPTIDEPPVKVEFPAKPVEAPTQENPPIWEQSWSAKVDASLMWPATWL